MSELSQGANLRMFINKQPTKVIAVCSGKGGVGKTNVAANLAVALGRKGRNTCLFDADLSLANVDVLLGLQPRFNLSHVVAGDTDLAGTILDGPAGIRIVPASSGRFCMTDLPTPAQVGIIQAFGELQSQPEVLVVDTSAGISPQVARFVQAAQHPMVVVQDEPASLTDAYALIKVFSQNYGITHFNVVTNRTRNQADGRRVYRKLSRVADSYLDVVLRHVGNIPADDLLVRAVQEQRAVVDAYPGSDAGKAFIALADCIDNLPVRREASGGIEFFFERLLRIGNTKRGMVA